MKFIMLFTILFCSSLTFADAGRIGSGGLPGEPRKIDIEEIRLLLEGDGLKNAILHYLETVDIAAITDPEIRSVFLRWTTDGRLKADILTPNNYKDVPGCVDAHDKTIFAWAKVGDFGGEICFDATKLAVEYRNLDAKERMIRLAALALHEHGHHLQSEKELAKKNEKEAYRFAAYVKNTAETVQPILLKWSPPLPSSVNSIDVYNCDIAVDEFKGSQEVLLIPGWSSEFTVSGRFVNRVNMMIELETKDLIGRFNGREFRGPLSSTQIHSEPDKWGDVNDAEISCKQSQNLKYAFRLIPSGEFISLDARVNRHQRVRGIASAALTGGVCYLGPVKVAFEALMKNFEKNLENNFEKSNIGSIDEKLETITIDYTGSKCVKTEPYYDGRRCSKEVPIPLRTTIEKCVEN